MIPGSNILEMALSVISAQTVTYYPFLSRTLNANALQVATYDTPIMIEGSMQPVPRQLYAEYGLDFEKSYYVFYTSTNVLPVTRDVSGDQIVFNNQRFQCESTTDWFVLDGWVGVLCIKIGSAA